MKINNVEFDFDVSDSENAAKLENATKHMEPKEKFIIATKGESLSEMLIALNKMLADFFIDATGADVLNGVTSYNKAKDCYFEFLAEVEKQKNVILAPYSASRVR